MLSIMKTFLNLLYRRILYKIPLKFLLLVLVLILCFISFSEASQLFAYNKQMSKNIDIPDYVIAWTTFYTDIVDIDKSNFTWKVKFLVQSPYNCSAWTLYVKGNSLNSSSYMRYSMNYINYGALCVSDEISLDWLNSLKFFYWTTQKNSSANYVQFVIVDSDSFDLSVKPLSTWFYASVITPSDCFSCPSTWDILSWYILESSIDSVYCENNNLCPVYTWDCENSSGVNWSSLYINNIQHLWWPNIYITIPEEIGRDYNYNDYDDMFINVSGYNVDYDKITWIIDVQNYKPSQEDFNNVIWILADYMPIIVIFLWLLFIYKMIRKPFKSKL